MENEKVTIELLFLRNIENKQAFFVSDSPKCSTCNTFVLYFKKIRV